MNLFDKIRSRTETVNKTEIQRVLNSAEFKNEIIRIAGDENNPSGILMTKAAQGKYCAEKVINTSQFPYIIDDKPTLIFDLVFQYFVSRGFTIKQSTDSQGSLISDQYDICWN